MLGERRAAVPEGRQPAARQGCARRRHARPSRAATSSSRSTPGSTRCGCTGTSPPATCTTPPTSSACCCCRTSRCSGGTHARSAGRPSTQARAAVDTLGHHPSIVQWNAHNEPAAVAVGHRGRRRAVTAAVPRRPAAAVVEQDRARPLGEAIDRARRPDPTGGAALGCAPPLPAARRHRQPLLLRLVPRRRPRHREARRAGAACGAVRVGVRRPVGARVRPTSSTPSNWPDLDWEHLAVHHGLQKWVFDQRVPPAEFATFDEWRHATQTYQAELVRHHVEVLRRLKYRPTGGFCVFALNDASPMVSWSLLDHERVPKLGWDALRQACQPVLVVADRPPSLVTPDEHLPARHPRRQRPAGRRRSGGGRGRGDTGRAASSAGGSAARSAPTSASRSARSISTSRTPSAR